MSKKYHAFYIWAYGYESRYECLDNEKDMLELVRKAREPDDNHGYRNLRIIYGDLLEFEPIEIVKSWKVKYD
jgi:hypothetical protein